MQRIVKRSEDEQKNERKRRRTCKLRKLLIGDAKQYNENKSKINTLTTFALIAIFFFRSVFPLHIAEPPKAILGKEEKHSSR